MVGNVDPHGMAGAGDQLKLGVGKLLDEWLGEGRNRRRIVPHRDDAVPHRDEPTAVAPGGVTGWE